MARVMQSLHMGIDSICILREMAGLGRSVTKYQERKAMPTVMAMELIGRLRVVLMLDRKLMG